MTLYNRQSKLLIFIKFDFFSFSRKNVFIVYFNCDRHRLQQLERESEELDQSFQAYLRRQQISKRQMNDDASKIWENYTLSKAALAQFDKIEDKHNIATAYQPKLTDAMKIDYVLNSTFLDDVDIEEVLKDLNEIKGLKSPRYNKNEAFPKSSSLFTFKSQNNGFKSFNERKEHQFEKQTKVENRMKINEKFVEKPSIISEKPFNPILEKPITIVAVEVAAEPKATEPKDKEFKSNAETNLQIKKLNTNGAPPIITSNHELVTRTKESIEIEIEKLLNAEKITQNEEIVENKSDVEIKAGALTNGHSIDKQANDTIHNTKQQEVKEIEKKNEALSPLKLNGVISRTTTTAKSKLDVIETVPIVTVKENGSVQLTSKTMINGFAKKLPTFMPIASDSDSAEISEQISIGQQRLIKSPDDFWI